MEINTIIREYTNEDAAEVANLYNKCSFYLAEYGYKMQESDIIDSFKERGTYTYLLALSDEKVIGMLGCFPLGGQKVAADNEVFVGSLLIHPEFRGSTLIKSLYANMIGKIVDLGVKCMCIEVFPSNDLSLRLAKKTGYVYTKSCNIDMDYYIDLKSYLPAVLQSIYIKDSKEPEELYSMGFTLLQTKEQQKALYIKSEIEDINREVITYPIKIFNAEYTIKVDVLSQSTYYIKTDDYIVSCHLEKGNQYKENEVFKIIWEFHNLNAEEKCFEIRAYEDKRIPMLLQKLQLEENSSKTIEKNIHKRRAGKYVVETEIHVNIIGKTDYYLRLGIGYEIGKNMQVAITKIDLNNDELELSIDSNPNQYQLSNRREKYMIKLEDFMLNNWMRKNYFSQQVFYDRKSMRNLYSSKVYEITSGVKILEFMSQLIVLSNIYSLQISLTDGQLKLYSRNGTNIMSELWPITKYPHVSGLKIDTKKKISFSITTSGVMLNYKKNKLIVKRYIDCHENAFNISGKVINMSIHPLEPSIGKIQPWIEWKMAQIYVPSNGEIFYDDLKYNIFPMGISDMITGNTYEFDVDTDDEGGGWTAFSDGKQFLKYSWNYSNELRFGQQWMPCLLYEVPRLGLYQSFNLPEYQFCIINDRSFLEEEKRRLNRFIYLSSCEVVQQDSRESIDLEIKGLIKTYSNFTITCDIMILIEDSNQNQLMHENIKYKSMHYTKELNIVEHVTIQKEYSLQLLFVRIIYCDSVRKREFVVPFVCRGNGDNLLVEQKRGKIGSEYLTEGSNLKFRIVPDYGQSMISLKFNGKEKLQSSYPKCYAFEAEQQWYGGITNYITSLKDDKLSNILNFQERLDDVTATMRDNKKMENGKAGLAITGTLRNGRINNKVEYVMTDYNVISVTSNYQLNTSNRDSFISVLSIYLRIDTKRMQSYGIYTLDSVNAKKEYMIHKVLNVDAFYTCKNYIIFEDSFENSYMVFACGDSSTQSICVNHFKKGLNIYITAPVQLEENEEQTVKFKIGIFHSRRDAELFGENVEIF